MAKARSRPFVIGVTGQIACGKSTVLGILAELGATTIDADRVYHELIRPGQPLWQTLRDHFGERIIGADGAIDRRALGSIVFGDPNALTDLERLTHPAIFDAVLDRIDKSTTAVVAIDAVKLVGSAMESLCDRIWLVECDPAAQLDRLMRRNGLSEDEARRRVAAQPALASLRARADLVIDNSGDVASTRAQVEQGWRNLPLLQC